jgi:hypothetical protein
MSAKGAKKPPRRGGLALVAGGEHDQVRLFHAAVLHHRAIRPEALDIGVLKQPDAPVHDHLRTAGIEVICVQLRGL